MLSLFRLLFTGALIYGVVAAVRNANSAPQTGDLANAFWVAWCVIAGLFAALAWAPLVGEKVAGPITGLMTSAVCVERKNWLMRLVRWLEGRRQRRLVRWLCFVEGVRHPWLPAQFITGLNNSGPGSWLERAFAREVYRFNNIKHVVQAHEALRRHGITPPPHTNAEVNVVLLSLHKAVTPPRPPMPVPPATTPPLQRNPRVRIFEDAPTPPTPPSPPTDANPEKEAG
ncbi:MAG: hypothetical protein ABSC03_07945 [Verrucomicrobiota bacterium]|jgi:hypothetical protein